MNLEDLLLQRADVWRAGDAPPPGGGLACGYPSLDAALNGGWPQGGLVEILGGHPGIGELHMLLPALARITRDARWLALVAPPYLPYAPALTQAGVQLAYVLQIRPRARADILWALEQTLRSGSCGAVLAWLSDVDGKQLRRLQLAAEAGNSTGFLFRSAAALHTHSPAAVRLQLHAAPGRRLSVHVLKRRGGWPTGPLTLEVDHALALSAFPASGN